MEEESERDRVSRVGFRIEIFPVAVLVKPNGVGITPDEFRHRNPFDRRRTPDAFLFSVDEYAHELRLPAFLLGTLGGGQRFLRLLGHEWESWENEFEISSRRLSLAQRMIGREVLLQELLKIRGAGLAGFAFLIVRAGLIVEMPRTGDV